MTESTISHDITSPAPGVLDAAAARADAAQPSLGATFREIFSDLLTYRELMYEFTRRDIRIRYKQAVMGFGWAIFMPILIVASGVLVRFAMGQVSNSSVGSAEIAGIAVKGIAWAFFVSCDMIFSKALT